MKGRVYRHGIVPARMPGVATEQATHREIESRKRTVLLDGLLGIAGAARIETASRSEQWTDSASVEMQQEDQERAHATVTACQWRSRLRRIALLSPVRTPLRAFTTISASGNPCWCKRKDSRTSRLTRLRRTALPTTRAGMDSPSRARFPALVRARTVKNESADRRACL